MPTPREYEILASLRRLAAESDKSIELGDPMSQSSTGAVRSDSTSSFLGDIPPEVLEALADAFEDGKAQGYPVGNWALGLPMRETIAHAMSHLANFSWGDESEDHLSHLLFNVVSLIYVRARIPQLDNRIFKQVQERFDEQAEKKASSLADAPPAELSKEEQKKRMAEVEERLANIHRRPTGREDKLET